MVGRVPEPVADGELARMAERRIADIVGQAGGLQDLAGEFRRGVVRQLAPAAQEIARHGAQRAAHAADFQRVAEARVDVVVTHQRMHLRLAGQTPERTGIDDAVPVLQKRAAGRVQLFEIHTAAPVAQGKQQFAPLFLKIHGTSRLPEMLAPCQYVQNLPRLYAEHKGGRGMVALLASPAGPGTGHAAGDDAGQARDPALSSVHPGAGAPLLTASRLPPIRTARARSSGG